MPTLNNAVHHLGCKNHLYRFLRQGWKLVPKYLMIFSHCIIQFCEFGFRFSLQSELFIDEINSLLSFLCPIDLSFWSCSIAKSCLFLSLSMLSLDSLENKEILPVKARAFANAPPINIATLAIFKR